MEHARAGLDAGSRVRRELLRRPRDARMLRARAAAVESGLEQSRTAGRHAGHDARSPQLGAAPLEEAPLGVGADQLERAVVSGTGVVGAIEPAQQVGAHRVQVVVAVELQPLDECERGIDVARLGDRDRLVELDTGEPVSRASSP